MKKSYQLLLIQTVLIAIPFFIHAQTPNLTQSIASGFSRLWYHTPQEKVYLHTDKSQYSAGEKIWFNAYVVNAATHHPNTRSAYVYVELIDRSDSVRIRVKIRRDSTGAAGFISIPPIFPPDEYVLRAYTHWMQNAGSEYFFLKKVFIGNQIDDRVKMDYSFGIAQGGIVPLTLTFKNTFGLALAEKEIQLIQHQLRRQRGRDTYTTDQQGRIHINLSVDTLNSERNLVEVNIKEPGLTFNRKINVPVSGSDFDLQFFPESGVFLDNQIQTLGFKAIGNDGLSVKVSGNLYNNRDEDLMNFSDFHKGMGKIVLKTSPGESYYALVRNEEGLEKRFDLPKTEAQGVALQLSSNRGRTFYQVYNQTEKPIDSLYLMVHSRGVVYLVMPLTQEAGQLPENILPAGISSYSIIDSLGNFYCERLNFIRNFNFPTVSMKSNKNSYQKRELVKLELNIASKPDSGSNYSVSVTDRTMVKRDTVSDNIISYLLLSSDIKGYIESPQDYFADNSNLTREKTDILMLTQGWRRFSTAQLLKNQLPSKDYYMEIGQTVSGRVYNLFNKPVKDSEIILLSGYKNQINTARTDSSGLFVIDGIEYPDSTNIILKAKSKSKIVDVALIPEPDRFPWAQNKNVFGSAKDLPVDDSYLQLSKEKYYNEGGMMVVNLEEFTVNAKAKTPSTTYYYSGMADKVFDEEKLQDYPGWSVLQIVSMFPGVEVNGDNVSIRGGGQPLFVIDGIETDRLEDVLYINANDIEEISLFRGPSATIFGSRGGNGAIAISLKKGSRNRHVTPPSLVHITPFGYQKTAEFYVPKYEVDSVLKSNLSDLRTTIYWNPSVQPDANGNIHLQFYSADKANDYELEMEGISNKGEICRFSAIIRRD